MKTNRRQKAKTQLEKDFPPLRPTEQGPLIEYIVADNTTPIKKRRFRKKSTKGKCIQ